MKKRILLLPPVLCILLALFPSALAEEAGALQVRDREYQNQTLSFTAALSGTDTGRLAVCVYDETGRLKDSAFYPAEDLVDVSQRNVADTDRVKAAWLDDELRPLAEPVLLRMRKNDADAYAAFTDSLVKMLGRSGGAGAEVSNPDALRASARLIVCCDALPDLSGWNAADRVSGPDGLWVLQFPSGESAKACAEYLRTLPAVRYAEQDAVIQPDEPADDGSAELPSAGEHLSWGIDASGMGKYGEALRSGGAAGGVTVAVVDSGVDLGHPFLSDRLLPGRDILLGSDDPQDQLGHGTHAAGIVADCTAGLDVKILPIRVLDDKGNCGSLALLASAVRCAADCGANVINLSLSAPASSCIDDAVRYAVSKNVTVVSAAGNRDTDTALQSPARVKEAVTVSAVKENGERVSLSNYGDAVDLSAPGGQVKSAYLRGRGDGGGDYKTRTGTSTAAPHVSAAAALLLCQRGTGQTPGQISDALRKAALETDLGAPGWDPLYGAGMLNLLPLLPKSRPSYSVTFDGNGGSGSMLIQGGTAGSTITLAGNGFIREGYRFTGWNTAADGSGTAYGDRASVMMERALTLYAQWEPDAA